MNELRNIEFLDTFADFHNTIVKALKNIDDDSANKVKVEYLTSLNAKNNLIYLNNYIDELEKPLCLLGDLLVKFTYQGKVQYLVCFLTSKKVIFDWSKPVNKIAFCNNNGEQNLKGEFFDTASGIIQQIKNFKVNISFGIFTNDSYEMNGTDKVSLAKEGFTVFTQNELERDIRSNLNIYFCTKIFKN